MQDNARGITDAPHARNATDTRSGRNQRGQGYSSGAIRESIQRRFIEPVIASRFNETRGDHFDRDAYRGRSIVERLIGWLKESRRVATRYDRLNTSYLAFVQLAAMRRIIQLL